MPNKPATVPQLDTNQTNRTVPAPSKVTDGFVLNDILPASNLNYLSGWTGDWLGWLDSTFADGPTAADLTINGEVLVPDGIGVGPGVTPRHNLTAAGQLGFDGQNGHIFGWNIYYDGVFKYVADDYGFIIRGDATGSLGLWAAPLNASGPDAAATPVERFRFTTDGKLAIGDSFAPDYKLHVVTTGASNGIFLEDSSDTSGTPEIRARGRRNDDNQHQGFSGKLVLERYRSEKVGVDPAGGDPINANVSLGAIIWGGNHTDSTESNIAYTSSIQAKAEALWTDAATMPTSLVFYTGSDGRALNYGSTIGTERMRIDSVGRVGIGDVPGSTSQVRIVNQLGTGAYELTLENSGQWMNHRCDATNGSFSGLVDAGDHTIAFSDGTQDTGTLVISAWNTGSHGIVINADGTHGINKEPVDAYTAPMLAIGGTALGGTAGDEVDIFAAHMTVTNQDYLRLLGRRQSTDPTPQWDTAEWRLQREVAGTRIGYIAFGDNSSDTITFGRDATEYARIDGTGRFGIGITPLSRLHVSDGASGQTPQAGTVVCIEDNASAYLSMLVPAANEAGIWMGRVGDRDAGRLLYRHADTLPGWALYSEAKECFKLDSEMRLHLGDSTDWSAYFTGASTLTARQTLNLYNDGTTEECGIMFATNWGRFVTCVGDLSGTAWRLYQNSSSDWNYFVAGRAGAGFAVGGVQIGPENTDTYCGIGLIPDTADGVLQLDTVGAKLSFIQVSTTGTPSTAAGWIRVKIGTSTRYIQCYSTAP